MNSNEKTTNSNHIEPPSGVWGLHIKPPSGVWGLKSALK